MTEYVILRKNEHGWEEIARNSQSSARASIQEALAVGAFIGEAAEEQAGTFVAVPARSWKPTTVAAETALRFSSA